MIVPMKKIYILVLSKYAEKALLSLRKLGLVHVQHDQVPQSKDISLLNEDISLVNNALEVLNVYYSEKSRNSTLSSHQYDWKLAARHLLDLSKRLEQLQEFSKSLQIRISDLEQWGNFDPELIEKLAEKDVFVQFFQVPLSQEKSFSIKKAVIIKKISVKSGFINYAIVSREKLVLDYKEVFFQKMSLSSLCNKLKENNIIAGSLKAEICLYSNYKKELIKVKENLQKDLDFNNALSGMGQADNINFLTGFVPVDGVESILMEAKTSGWAVKVIDPAAEENVPTLLRTPKWVDKIKPIFELLGILPGYTEIDVSVVFLIFFSIFFGILIGDAGYGAVYLGLTFWMHKKFGNKAETKNVISLLYVLSFCAILWGVLTATFFGQAWLTKFGIKALVPQLNDVKTMQAFCFFLGAFHLTIAHSWRAILKFPSLTFLADLGWICVLWTAFFLAKTLILSESFPGFGQNLAYAGIALVVFFTNPQKNILKTILEGLGTIALSLMNNFTDVVSYVRLFAVGMAGVAIAETTNIMASGLGDGVVAVICGILIVIVGHALNIVLGPMSVLVHGVRLNVLEFSGHANIGWSGFKYNPLKE